MIGYLVIFLVNKQNRPNMHQRNKIKTLKYHGWALIFFFLLMFENVGFGCRSRMVVGISFKKIILYCIRFDLKISIIQ